MGLLRNWITKYATEKAFAEMRRLAEEYRKLRVHLDRVTKLLHAERNTIVELKSKHKTEVDLLKTEIDRLNTENAKLTGEVEYYTDRRDQELTNKEIAVWDAEKKVTILENENEVLRLRIRNLEGVVEREFERTKKEAAVFMRGQQDAINGAPMREPML